MAIEFRDMKPLFGLREPWSGLSHAAGLLLSVAGLFWMLSGAWEGGEARHIVSAGIFGLSLIGLYFSSTLYHCLHGERDRIIKLNRFDHMMIFVLIAGTYTPICLIALDGTLGWSTFAAVWALALVGIACKMFWLGMPRWIGVAIYLAMGWVGALLLPQLAAVMSPAALKWLIAGGAFYSVGAIIYALKWPNFIDRVWEFHETWHVFVLLGSASHVLAVRACLA